jgi:hypothetical protein
MKLPRRSKGLPSAPAPTFGEVGFTPEPGEGQTLSGGKNPDTVKGKNEAFLQSLTSPARLDKRFSKKQMGIV